MSRRILSLVAALGVFAAATVFLGFALKWPDRTVKTAVALTLLPKFSPGIASKIEEKLHSMISGFRVLRDPRNLVVFVAWSLIYWTANGFSLLVLARGFGLGCRRALTLGGEHRDSRRRFCFRYECYV